MFTIIALLFLLGSCNSHLNGDLDKLLMLESSNEKCIKELKLGQKKEKIFSVLPMTTFEKHVSGAIDHYKLKTNTGEINLFLSGGVLVDGSCYKEHSFIRNRDSKKYSLDESRILRVKSFNQEVDSRNICHTSTDCTNMRGEYPFKCWYAFNRNFSDIISNEYKKLRSETPTPDDMEKGKCPNFQKIVCNKSKCDFVMPEIEIRDRIKKD